MRFAIVALLVAAPAFADPKLEKIVTSNITGLASLADDDTLNFTASSIVIEPSGNVVDMSAKDGCVTGAVANSFYGCAQASISHAPGKVIMGVDAKTKIAWFQAAYDRTIEADNPDGGPSKPETAPMRVGGILVDDGGWEIATAMYVGLVSDKQLLAGTGGKIASGAPKLSGDKKLAGVVAGWFPSGFEAAAAKTGTLIASGTSKAEFASGAGATKLAKSFDKLKLGVTKVDAKLLAGGKVGWVVAEVAMPRKNGKGAVDMNLAVVVPDGAGGWRWVSFQYQFQN